MKWAFKKISFGALGYFAITVQITEPFAVLFVRKMFIRIIMHHFMPCSILFISCCQVCKQCGNNRFIMGPPELHILPVFLYRLVINITKIPDASIFLIPSPLP